MALESTAAGREATARYRHAFIVTHGRSGSTLLQGILNACAGVTILGENHGFHYYLYKALESVRLSLGHLQGGGPDSPFFGADRVNLADIEAGIADLMHRHLYGAAGTGRLLGFKEIRHDMPDLEGYLDFLGQIFPTALLIFLTRDIRETAVSGFWRQGEQRLVEDKLRYMQDAFHAYARRHPERSHVLDYRDLVEAGPGLRGLLERLELALDDATLAQILATPHSHEVTSIVFYDNARIARKPLGELESRFAVVHFEQHRLEADSRVRFSGILLPRAQEAALEAIYLLSPGHGERHAARLGLPTPGYAAKHPGNAHAGNCRFAVDIAPEHSRYELHVVQGGQDFVLADIHVAPSLARTFFD